MYETKSPVLKEILEEDVFPAAVPPGPPARFPADVDVALDASLASLATLPEATPAPQQPETQEKPNLTTAFQEAVERLVTVHITELVEAQRRHYEDMPGESSRGLAPMRSQRSALPTMRSSASRLSSATSKTSSLRHRSIREIPAVEVLDKLEDQKPVENPLFGNQMLEDMLQQMKDDELKSRCNREPSFDAGHRLAQLRSWLQSSRFEVLVTSLLCVHVLWMALELQFYGSLTGYRLGIFPSSIVSEESWPVWEQIFWIGDMAFTTIFTVDVFFRIIVLQGKFWRVCMNYVDVLVTLTSLIEVAFVALVLPMNPTLFRLLRIGKLARALRMVTMTSVLSSLQLLIKCLSASLDMLFWTFCLLTFLQCVAGMVVSTLCREYVNDLNQDLSKREEVYRYYGTFSRTFLTMFEILFANWSPPCRALVDHVSEWFSLFFLVYRCIIGFAVRLGGSEAKVHGHSPYACCLSALAVP
ncbi:unnamed protein product [Durusdinium trenchii]|uniref:Ion transport domain-containing protein n=2 Tax=Durusdinium trenchii TaxID=1381693 RepID=A0ABP0IQG2_9DINO